MTTYDPPTIKLALGMTNITYGLWFRLSDRGGFWPESDLIEVEPVELGDCEVSATEDHDAIIARWESKGWIDPNCKACVDMGYYSAADPASVFAPRHLASNGCESGKNPHCTCRSCF